MIGIMLNHTVTRLEQTVNFTHITEAAMATLFGERDSWHKPEITDDIIEDYDVENQIDYSDDPLEESLPF